LASRSPVVTGLGIVAAPGHGVEAVWTALAGGAGGLKPLGLFPSPRHGPVPVGEIQEDLNDPALHLRGSRSDRLAWLAVRQAIASASLSLSDHRDRAGMLLGSSVGGSYDSERFLEILLKRRCMRALPTRYHECNSAVSLIAANLGLLGPCMTIATACSSGALALATAAEMIQSGEADIMLAGGADSLSRMTWGGFHALLLVDAEGCRPFDAQRNGMSLGEGGAVLVLEAEETARARGANILARLGGWGASCDAHHATAPHREGRGALAAMRSALARAGLEPGAMDYLNAHGTGTRDNDLAEARALRSLFGERVPPFSSTKHFFGHALAASGALEAVICIEALRRQLLPPNLGFTSMDPAIGLEPVTAMRSASLTHVMSNSFGFGGNNAVLIFSHPDAAVAPREAPHMPVAVRGVGVIGPGTRGLKEIEPPLPAGEVASVDCGPLAGAGELTMNQRRRLSRLMQMVVLAARRSVTADATGGDPRLAVAIGTGMGCLGDAGIFLENLIEKEEREPMPSRFPASVHNAPAAQLAIDRGAQGLNAAPTTADISFECALWLAMRQLVTGEADQALAGAVDELNKYLLSIGQRWGFWNETTQPGEGAVVAALGRVSEKDAPCLARVSAVRLGRFERPFDAAREARWMASATDLGEGGVLYTGAGGWPELDPCYAAVADMLGRKSGSSWEHRTYKSMCGEYHSASSFGFAQAVECVRAERRRAMLYTLSPRGFKALCCLQP